MIEQGIDGAFRAIDQADHARRQAQLVDQIKNPAHRHRHLLGRLEYETIAAGNGIGQEPERDHAGKVEWRDSCDRAHRLAKHVFIDTTRDVFNIVAHHQRRDATRDLHVLDAALQLALRLGQRLAALLRCQTCDLVVMVLQQLLKLEKVLDAFSGRCSPPVSKGRLRGLRRLMHLFSRRERHAHDRLGGCRVTHIQKFPRLRPPPLPPHIVE